jgi:hypothetical protein
MAQNSNIEWKTIPGYPLYQVSNDGRVQSCAKRIGKGRGLGSHIVPGNSWKEKIISNDAKGYPVTTLGRGNKRLVHHLVLLAFVGPRPENQECRHLDGNPQNNRLDNLQWGTSLENHADQKQHGTRVKGERHYKSKVSDSQRAEIKARYQGGELQKNLGREFGLTQATVSYLVNH